MKKNKFPRTLLVMDVSEDRTDPTYIGSETPEDISEDYAGDPVAVYELVAVGSLSVEKQVDAKPVKKVSVSTKKMKTCSACGNTFAWHVENRPRHVFVAK